MAATLRPYLTLLAAQILGPKVAVKTSPSDVVQQSLVNALERKPPCAEMDRTRLRAWLIKVVRNAARTAVRDQTRLKRSVRREEPVDADLDGERAGQLPTPSESLGRRERAERVAAAVARLPDNLRQVVALRAFEDLSWPEVAQRMGLSEGAARRLWAQAIERLKHLLADEP